MKKILLPTDFSPNATHAAKFALSLAELIKAKIVLLHANSPIVDPYDPNMTTPQLTNVVQEVAEEGVKNFKKKLLLAYKNNKSTAPIIESKIVWGTINSSIIEVAKEEKADFIVMGTTGSADAFDQLFGSSTLSVARHATCPVWIIPEKTKLNAIKSIVFATDLDNGEIGCISQAIDIAQLMGVTIKALHVHSPEQQEIYSTKEIINLIKQTEQAEVTKFEDLSQEEVIKGLDNYMSHHKADAIVVAHQHKSFIEQLFHTSILKHLTYTAKVPLLILQKKE